MTEERFYMPVKVISGREAVREHASGLKGFGKKALIVTGRRSAKACGVYDDICAALEEAGIGTLRDAAQEQYEHWKNAQW